jgi:dephospho-CoA kinase
MPAAGKEEFRMVAAEAGYLVVRMGDIVREEAFRRGLPTTDAAVGDMAHQERQKHGDAIWAERTVPRVLAPWVCIDGLRSAAELFVFRRAFGKGLVVFAIEASPETRWKRIQRRHRADDAETFEEFLNRDARETGWGLPEVIRGADVRMTNEGTLDEFHETVRRALRRLDD